MYQVIETARMDEFGGDSAEHIAYELRMSADMVVTDSGLAGLVTFTIDQPNLATTFRAASRDSLEKLIQWDAPDIHFGEITEV
jgi:hypothetical protein